MIPTYDASNGAMPPLFPEAGEGRYAPPPMFASVDAPGLPPVADAAPTVAVAASTWLRKSIIGAVCAMLATLLVLAVVNFWAEAR